MSDTSNKNTIEDRLLQEERDYLEITIGGTTYCYLLPSGVDAARAMEEDMIVYRFNDQTIRVYDPKKEGFVKIRWHMAEEWGKPDGMTHRRNVADTGEEVQEILDQWKQEEIRDISRLWKWATSEEINPKMAHLSEICSKLEPGWHQKEGAGMKQFEYRLFLKEKYPLHYILWFSDDEDDYETIWKADGW